MKWIYWAESRYQAGLSVAGSFVISHRPQRYICSYRKNGNHVHVGEFPSEEEAKSAAEAYLQQNPEP